MPQQVSNPDQVEKMSEIALRNRAAMQKIIEENLQGAVLSEKQPEPPLFIDLEHKTSCTVNAFFFDLPDLPESERGKFGIIITKTNPAPDGRLLPKSSGYAAKQTDAMTEILKKYPDVYFQVSSDITESSYDNLGGAEQSVRNLKQQRNLIGTHNTKPKLNFAMGLVMIFLSRFNAEFVKDIPESVSIISNKILPKFKAGKLKELQANRSMDLADLAKAEKKINQKSEQ